MSYFLLYEALDGPYPIGFALDLLVLSKICYLWMAY